MNKYNHLTPEERALIMIEYNHGESVRTISSLLNRSPSTVSREISRNKGSNSNTYCANSASKQYRARRELCVKPKKLVKNTLLYNQVIKWLIDKQWSPEQISGALKRHFPKQKKMQVSHEVIYAYIYAHPRGALRKLFIQTLRRSKSKRGPRGSKDSNYNSIKLTSEQLIHNRPKEVDERKVPDHWEGDLVAGSQNKSCVGTLVERKTGYLILSKMQNKSALSVREGFEAKMESLPSFLRLSMTYDRGCEMAQHTVLSDNLGMRVYFADPHAPWQRGSNENTNGLLRQYLPKEENLSSRSQEDLDEIAYLLNTRPRKRFDFKTPQDAMKEILIKNGESVALAS